MDGPGARLLLAGRQVGAQTEQGDTPPGSSAATPLPSGTDADALEVFGGFLVGEVHQFALDLCADDDGLRCRGASGRIRVPPARGDAAGDDEEWSSISATPVINAARSLSATLHAKIVGLPESRKKPRRSCLFLVGRTRAVAPVCPRPSAG